VTLCGTVVTDGKLAKKGLSVSIEGSRGAKVSLNLITLEPRVE
jgi:hypothetical protein